MSGLGRGRRALVIGAAFLLGIGGITVVRAVADQEPSFPHEEHAGLFPLCTGCHEGIATGDSALAFPSPELCGRCHDGEELETVDWRGRRPEVDNLRFEHVAHASGLADEGEAPLACTECHTESGEPRMAVRGPQPDRCLSCHEHQAESHYADAACATCHVPLAESRFSLARIRELPRPASHEEQGFLLEVHGEAAEAGTESCATCHTRETCTSCHVDGASREAIAALPAAPEEMRLPEYEARYPAPPSHEDEAWLEVHGRSFDGGAACSACHTRQSCTSCHVPAETPEIASLPDAREATAPGADVARTAPRSHSSPFFESQHGTLAASQGAASCTTCHAPAQCTTCHDGESVADAGYHPPDFLARHSAQAYGRSMECSTCHDTQAFCRDCHTQLGMKPQGRLGPAFHDGQPLWFLRHGQAARQSLESCASCHRQRDCLQCHSTLGAFQVNPHGPGFDAEGYAERNREICFACHVRDPLDGRNP